MKRSEAKLFLLFIVFFGFLIRVLGLNFSPPSLNWDEVSHGYNAYSLLKTGKDEWGEAFPVIFRAFGDYKLPVYIYLTAVSEFFFGLSAFSVRIVSVLAGTATILFTFKLSEKILKDRSVAVLAALLVAVEPWSLFLSRIAVEANLALALILSGIYFAFVGLEKRGWHFVLSMLLFGLSVWTYNSARVFVPLFLLGGGLIYRGELGNFYRKASKKMFLGVFVLVVFLVPMFVQLVKPTGSARYSNVTLLDEGAVASIEQRRNESSMTPLFSRAIYNRPVYFGEQFLRNYVSHFGPSFLFVNGGDDYQFNIPNTGLIYIIQVPFILLGGYFVLRSIERKELRLIVAWVLLAPVASSVTRGSPHTLRAITLLPLPMILASYGVIKYISFFKTANLKKFMIALYLILLASLFIGVSAKYLSDYRTNYSWTRQYGYEQAIDFARENYENYDKIVITKKYGEPHEFVLFYWTWNPREFRSDPNLVRFNQSNWWWVDRFDKFYFVNDWDFPENINEEIVLESGESVGCREEGVRCLIITDEDSAPEGWGKLKEINYLDGDIAFVIYEE